QNVDAALDGGDNGLDGLGGLLEEVFSPALQWPRVHPANARREFCVHPWQLIETHEHIASAHVDVILKQQGDRLRAERFRARAIISPDFFDRALQAARQHHDALALAIDATVDLTAGT